MPAASQACLAWAHEIVAPFAGTTVNRGLRRVVELRLAIAKSVDGAAWAIAGFELIMTSLATAATLN